MKVGYYLIPNSDNNGYGAAVCIPRNDHLTALDETTAALESRFDCTATILALQDAIRHIQEGDGIGATGAAAEAFARLAFFHRILP